VNPPSTLLTSRSGEVIPKPRKFDASSRDLANLAENLLGQFTALRIVDLERLFGGFD
jgi:hypothetical protein